MAQRIDGTAVAKAIREKINADIHRKQETAPKYKPSLVIVQGTSQAVL
jgi:methylenetetrahydrofolate dehydrogenase (NADP+)/methenyltetrahydrofolate cyclohydrolase/formyltetrahydrofolate synthetase